MYGRLQAMTDYLIDQFIAAGLVSASDLGHIKKRPDGSYKVQFHMTLLNGKFSGG